jgi:hypothetical protein
VRQERFFALEEGFAFARSETKKLRRRIMPQRIMPQWVRKKLAEMRRAESAGNAAGESSGGSSFGDPEKVDDNQPLPEACHFRCENRVCRFRIAVANDKLCHMLFSINTFTVEVILSSALNFIIRGPSSDPNCSIIFGTWKAERLPDGMWPCPYLKHG